MEQLTEFLGLNSLEPALRNRLIYASFCLLIAMLLFYFWNLAKDKEGAQKKNSNGLVYLSLTYLVHFVIGFASVYNANMGAQLVLSGLISAGYLLSLPFFSLSDNRVDQVIEHPYWENGIKMLGVAWLIVISWTANYYFIRAVDELLSVIAFMLFGFFITRYFIKRKLWFIAVISVLFFVSFALLQVVPPSFLVDEGKFDDMNTVIFGPALMMSVIVLAYTFNWLNELNFYELSRIWVNDPQTGTEEQKQNYNHLTLHVDREKWIEKIATDDLESVIDEMIIYKKHKNQNLETLLNVASRNNRNNNNQLKDLIKYEDYQLNRNKISEALIVLVREV